MISFFISATEQFMCPSCHNPTNERVYTQETCDKKLVEEACKTDQMCVAVRVIYETNRVDRFFRGCIEKYQKLLDAYEALPANTRDPRNEVGKCSTSGCLANLGHEE